MPIHNTPDASVPVVEIDIPPADAHGSSHSWVGTPRTYRQGLQRILAMAFGKERQPGSAHIEDLPTPGALACPTPRTIWRRHRYH